MTREEREAIEGRYAVRDVDKYPCRAAFSGTCPSGRDVNFLLAALDKMEADHQMSVNEAALSIKHLKTARDLHKRRTETLDVELRADRDRWKERAEALERAMKSPEVNDHNSLLSPRCSTCIHRKEENYESLVDCAKKCKRGSAWQFDEARFSGKAE